MRVAIVHDWLVTYAGSERVVEQLLRLYPQADLFSLFDFMSDRERGFLQGRRPATSFLQHAPWVRSKYPRYLPLMPLAIEQFDLSAYDLVLSSSHCVAKGVITGPDQLHICYMHSPMRYAWDLQHEYLRGANLERGLRGWAARWMLHKLRMWDVRSASGVDHFVANSRFVARRAEKAYRRGATVIHPPVDVNAFSLQPNKEDFYLTASRLVPYKRVDLLVQAFAELPDKRLVVVGDGPELARLRAQAGPNVRLIGYQEADALRDTMARARGFLFASQEDFGIVLVESQACGTPVIAYGKGGALETVRGLESERPTGLFFGQQTVPAIVDAIRTFEQQADRFDPQACRENAQQFCVERFCHEMRELIEERWAEFQAGRTEAQPPLGLRAMPDDEFTDPDDVQHNRHAA